MRPNGIVSHCQSNRLRLNADLDSEHDAPRLVMPERRTALQKGYRAEGKWRCSQGSKAKL